MVLRISSGEHLNILLDCVNASERIIFVFRIKLLGTYKFVEIGTTKHLVDPVLIQLDPGVSDFVSGQRNSLFNAELSLTRR